MPVRNARDQINREGERQTRRLWKTMGEWEEGSIYQPSFFCCQISTSPLLVFVELYSLSLTHPLIESFDWSFLSFTLDIFRTLPSQTDEANTHTHTQNWSSNASDHTHFIIHSAYIHATLYHLSIYQFWSYVFVFNDTFLIGCQNKI